jgi:hypothetical protein
MDRGKKYHLGFHITHAAFYPDATHLYLVKGKTDRTARRCC